MGGGALSDKAGEKGLSFFCASETENCIAVLALYSDGGNGSPCDEQHARFQHLQFVLRNDERPVTFFLLDHFSKSRYFRCVNVCFEYESPGVIDTPERTDSEKPLRK